MTRATHVRAGFVVVLGAFAAGCNLAPPYSAPPAPLVGTTYKEIGPWTQAMPQDALPRSEWWTLYGDLTLDALEGRIEAGNPTLAEALARNDAADAYVTEAQSAYFPVVGTEENFTQNRQSDNRPLRSASQPDFYGADTVGASINYELDIWGSIRNQVAAAKDEAQATDAQTQFIRLSLEADLADSYLGLRESDAQVSSAYAGRRRLRPRAGHDAGAP